MKPADLPRYRYRGLVYGLVIILTWFVAVGAGLFLISLRWETLPLAIPLMLLIAFLYTGLFITAHDAMHRTLLPRDPFWNDLIGRFCVFIFALFSYAKLKRKHDEHHRAPATNDDPDYHDGRGTSYARWYLHFMLEYVSWPQIMGMGLIFCFLWIGLRVPLENVLMFWAGPSILSTFQLFTFGTYLPHREPRGGYTNEHRATSHGWPRWVGFLTCYHFGRHFEHHEWPFVPWWELGRVPPQTSRGK